MEKQKFKSGMERRSADRVSDNSCLLVEGKELDGKPFSEMTSINDVSTGGISFFLTSLPAVGDMLNLSIWSEKWTSGEVVPRYQIKAKVLRVAPTRYADNVSLIAAEFASHFINLSGEEDFESIVRNLQRAVAYDENRRQQY